MRSFSRFLAPVSSRALVVAALAGGLWALPTSAQNAPAAGRADGTAWTTFKGDAQRRGASAAQVNVPLSLQWRFTSPGPADTYRASPLVVGTPGRQRVIFGAGRFIYALDSQTGEQIWRSPELFADILTPLTLLQSAEGDLVIAAQQNGRIAAVDTAKGGLAWTPPDVGASVTEAGPIVVQTLKGQLVICANDNGNLIAFDALGNIDPTWKATLGQSGNSPTSSMTLSGDGQKLFVTSADARLFAFDAPTGRLLYAVPLGRRTVAAPLVDGSNVITANTLRVAASSVNDGRQVWSFAPRGEISASPALGGGGADRAGANRSVFFGTRNGYFQAVDALTGKLRWEKQLDAVFTGSPLVIPGAVIVGTQSGVMVGFNPETGDVVWQNRLQTERTSTRRRRVRTQNTQGSSRRSTGRESGRNEGGGGEGGGGEGGATMDGGGTGDGGATTERLVVSRPYPISSAPAAINGQVFVLGDNAAIYALSSGVIDADPVRVIEPSLSVPGARGALVTFQLTPQTPVVIRGDGPIYLAAGLEDVGAGVDASSLRVILDNVPLAADRVAFDPATGVLTLTLLDPTKRDAPFEDGLKNLVVAVRDYGGNELSYTTSFVVDKTAPAPEEAARRPRGDRDGAGGRNDRGGGRGGGNGGNQRGGNRRGGNRN